MENINNIGLKRLKTELTFYYLFSTGVRNRYYAYFNKKKNVLSDTTLIDVTPKNDKIISTFHLKLSEKKFTFVILELCPQYPFKAPEIKIMGENYKSLLCIDSVFLKKFNIKNECLCCSSFCCRNNWHCGNNISDILLEIKTNLNIKIRINDRKMCEFVLNHFFGYYLPIATFL